MYTHHTYVNTDTRLCSNLDTFGPSPPQATPSLCSPYSRVSSPAGTPPSPAHVLTALTTRLSPIIRGKRLPEGGRKACLRPVFLGSPSCVAGRLPVENVVRRQICILLPVEIKKKKNVKPPRVGGKVLVAALWGRLSSSGRVLDSPLASRVCVPPTSVSIAESLPPSLYNSESPPIYLTE